MEYTNNVRRFLPSIKRRRKSMEQTVSIDLKQKAYVPAFVDRIVRPLTRVLNPLIMRFAGGWWFPMFSVLRHRGRRSGQMYSTPISAMPRGQFFWLGLTFGEDAAWARNILAAGECDLRYRGTDYHLVEPAVLDSSAVRSQLPQVMALGLAMLGVPKVLRMRSTAKH
jgi:deazaflavin-dependent oxidoreductase (nitroreductase family)